MKLAIRSFQKRVFLAILAVAVVPAVVAVVAGTIALREVGRLTGTLGPWDAVASSGRGLLDAVRESGSDDPAVARNAETHREALSESARRSRVYALVAGRLRAVLPLAALITGVALVGLASLAARRLARGFSGPISELVGWTERIGRGEPLPPAPAGSGSPPADVAEDEHGIREFEVLRRSLRRMAADLDAGRRRDVEAARLRAWTELARGVAHELKNPLTPMRMAARTLERDATGAGVEAARVLVEEIDRLDEMARSFAQFGRLPEGPPSEVDLKELLEALATQHGTDAVAVRVHAADALPRVLGHYDLLARAFRNLLVNAVEAMEGRRGTVDVHVYGRNGTERALAVRVRDHGPGIPDAVLRDMWLPDVTTKRRGTGLGLPLVRQAIEAHGGTVRGANLPDGGAEFEVQLPLGGGERG